MKSMQQNISIHENFDQQIGLNSDRGFLSVGSTVESADNKDSNENDLSMKMSSQKSIQMAKGVPFEKISIDTVYDANCYDLTIADHPFACIATVLFKSMALLSYTLMGLILPQITIFVIVLIASALDFWTVKNVTGRLLVGMRWWSSDGEEGWRFENVESGHLINQVDKTYFWTGQIGATLIWGMFLLVQIFSLNLFWVSREIIQGMLSGINFGLCFFNLYGYYKCREEYQVKFNRIKFESFKYLSNLIYDDQF